MIHQDNNISCNFIESSLSEYKGLEDDYIDNFGGNIDNTENNSDSSQKNFASNSGILIQITAKIREVYFNLNIFQKIIMICGFGVLVTEFAKLITTNYSLPFFLVIGITMLFFIIFVFTFRKTKDSDTRITNEC